MGQLHHFECTACGYNTEVSGGSDAGMLCCTQTILCETCEKLYDAESARPPLFESMPLRCPRSKKHSIRLWQHPGPCPKCGAEMQYLGETAIWD
jgi:hypothetical protein